ncbi:MAG TPA: TonB-dependent receptor [Thermoanaerobaculia bacterium]
MRKLFRSTALFMVLSLVTFAAFAQTSGTTGALRGQVTDTAGAPLPGVTVTITSPQLQGTRVAVTDEQGQYLFPLLPSGTYRAEYALSGIRNATRDGIQINVQRATDINVQMQLAVSETVVVTASQVVVDPTQTQTQQTFREDHLKYASIGSGNRSYQNVLQQAAAVGGGANPQVSGANLAQNDWLVDGVNTTDPVTHTFGPNLAFDSIQEISVVTLGKDAEYSSSGGTINVITKSGGNRFSGSFDYRYSDPDFLESGDHFNADVQTNKNKQPQATLGGPIVRDRLWFFASTARPETSRVAPNLYGFQPGSRDFFGWNTLGKLTWTPIANQTLGVRFIDSHANISHIAFSSLYRPDGDARQVQKTRTYALSYDAVLSSSWLANLQIGHTPGSLGVEPMTGDLTTPGRIELTVPQIRSVNYTNHQGRTSERNELVASSTYYLEGFGGRHAFKAGLNLEETSFTSFNYIPGDVSLIPFYDPALCSPQFGFPTGSTCTGYVQTNQGAPFRLVLGTKNPESTVGADGQAVYVQDEWNPIPRLTARIGLRYDQIQWDNAGGNPIPDFDMVQPRIGVAYDVFNNANTVVHAYGGRIMDDNQLTLPSHGVIEPVGSVTFQLNAANQWGYRTGSISQSGVIIDQNLKPAYSDQFSVGLTQRILRNTSIDVTWENRKQRDMFEDYCGFSESGDITEDDVVFIDCLITNNPQGTELRGDFNAFITKIESRPAQWLDLVASWTHGRSRATTSGSALGESQNASTSFDIFPIHFINRYGYTSEDARDRIKLNGFARLPWDFIVGASYYWDSGTPWSVVQSAAAGNPVNIPYGEYYLEPRGSRRFPHYNQLDVQLQKNFRVGPVTAGVIGSVINALSSEYPITIQNNPGATAFIDANGQLQNAVASFGTATAWQQPRRYEVGVRFEF